MKEFKELLDFVLQAVEDETSYPELVARDAQLFDLIDSMGTVGLLCDIEEAFLEQIGRAHV